MANEQHAGAILRHLERLVETETLQGWSDGQLLQRFAMQREEEAFAALVHRHGRLVWGVCRHILHHEQDAEDAFQATFFVLARRAAAVRKFESIGSWLHGVAYRVAVRAKRTAAKRLISGSSDTTALVWDLTGALSARQVPLRDADLDAYWTDLAGADAERAYRSIHRLAGSPTEMVPYLEKRLQPVARVDARRVEQLIVDLGSDQFAVRDQATKELENLGEAAIALCRKALAKNPPLEQRRRLERLVEKEEQERWSPPPERLRTLRALEALECAGTPAARRLLQNLAAGAPEASRTREAKAALERLKQQARREP